MRRNPDVVGLANVALMGVGVIFIARTLGALNVKVPAIPNSRNIPPNYGVPGLPAVPVPSADICTVIDFYRNADPGPTHGFLGIKLFTYDANSWDDFRTWYGHIYQVDIGPNWPDCWTKRTGPGGLGY